MRLDPLPQSEWTQDMRAAMRMTEELMGFVPSSMLVIGRNPALSKALRDMVAAVYGPGHLDMGFKRLVAVIASSAAACEYCVAHNVHGAERFGIADEKLAAVWDYETSPLFSDAERAALRVAQRAALVPNAVTDRDFETLKIHYDADAIVEIVGVVALFGFLNRWNSTMRTDIEGEPASALARLATNPFAEASVTS